MTSPIIILGMHRSGTSLLARALDDLGVFMGYRLDDHHEARFFRKLNDWALRQANAAWDRPLPFGDITERQADRIESVFRRHLGGIRRFEYLGPLRGLRHGNVSQLRQPWGWKDPRNTFLLDIWLRIFPDARILHIHRHPLDVARSLQAREERVGREPLRGMPLWLDELRLTARPLYCESVRARRIEGGVELWHEYVAKAESLRSRGLKFHELSFEELLTEPRRILGEIASFLELDVTEAELRSIAGTADPSRKYPFLTSDDLVGKLGWVTRSPLANRLGYADVGPCSGGRPIPGSAPAAASESDDASRLSQEGTPTASPQSTRGPR